MILCCIYLHPPYLQSIFYWSMWFIVYMTLNNYHLTLPDAYMYHQAQRAIHCLFYFNISEIIFYQDLYIIQTWALIPYKYVSLPVQEISLRR